VIDGERLLTNAHVVKSAIDIRVRPHGSTRRFPAKVSNEYKSTVISIRYYWIVNIKLDSTRLNSTRLDSTHGLFSFKNEKKNEHRFDVKITQ
jgi:hypothetical protein